MHGSEDPRPLTAAGRWIAAAREVLDHIETTQLPTIAEVASMW